MRQRGFQQFVTPVIALWFGMACTVLAEDVAELTPLKRLQQQVNAQEVELATLRQILEGREAGDIDGIPIKDVPAEFRKQLDGTVRSGTSGLLGQETTANRSSRNLPATSNNTYLLQDLQRQLKAQELEIQGLKTNALGATYNRGFLLQTTDPAAVPFRLKVNGRMQGRYTNFSGSGSSQTPRNHFEIERGRLEFRGHMYDPALQFYYNLDADTDDNHDVKFHDFWINYNFDDAFKLYFGKQKVASGETWLHSSTNSRFADRDVATTFFKADRTIGLRADGVLGDEGQHYYQALLGNGLRSTDLEAADIDDLFVFSLLHWSDLAGNVGNGYSDLAWHQDLAVRLGQSLTYTNQDEAIDSSVLSEARWVRLGNGTPLTDTGALAPGVTVIGFDYYLYSAFLIAKYRGWSVNSEFYYRWLNNFDTSGGSVTDDIDTRGFVVDVGYMLVPKSVEVMARIDAVNSAYGDSLEYAAGINWFINGTHKHKLTLDVAELDGVPAGSSSPNFETGQVGTLFRLQYQVAF